MEQLGLTGMPTPLFRCTPSRLTTWLDCPRRYQFEYVDRPTPPRGLPWAHNSVGAAAHLALAQLWDRPVERRTPDAARAIVAQVWQTDGFSSDQQSATHREATAEQVASYVERLDVSKEPRGVERTVGFTTDRLTASGRIDRVDERDGELVVVDYKTGRSALTTDDARGSLALAFYVLGCRRTFRRPAGRVELHHLPPGKVHAWDHTEESLARHVERAEAVAVEAKQAASTGEFPPSPSSLCGWCDFVQHCPEGIAASGGPKKPWSALADLT